MVFVFLNKFSQDPLFFQSVRDQLNSFLYRLSFLKCLDFEFNLYYVSFLVQIQAAT